MINLESGILHIGIFNYPVHNPQLFVLSPSESFRSYAFWLGRDSDELLELVD